LTPETPTHYMAGQREARLPVGEVLAGVATWEP
jgi:hypothetical protein